MPQGDHIELHRKRQGFRLDHHERLRKKEARVVHKRAAFAQKAIGLKGKLFAKKRHQEKITMKKTLAMHQERDNKHKAEDGAKEGALPAYLLEREQVGLFADTSATQLQCYHTIMGGAVRLCFEHPIIRRVAVGGGTARHVGALAAAQLQTFWVHGFTGRARKGLEQHNQAEAKGKGWQVGSATAKGDALTL